MLQDGPALRSCGRQLVLREPGKNSPGIKLARAFIAGILFLNAVETTSLEGKSRRSGPACGMTAYLCPMVNVPLAPGGTWLRGTASAEQGADPAPGMLPGCCVRSGGHKGQQGWMGPACRHCGGQRVPEKLWWEGPSYLSRNLPPGKIQMGCENSGSSWR